MKKALIVIVSLYVFAAVLLGILWVFGSVDATAVGENLLRLAEIAVIVAIGWGLISLLIKQGEK